MTTNFGRSPEASVAMMSSTEVCAASCTGASASPRRCGAHAHLVGGFLAGDVDDAAAAPRQRRAGLDQQRRLADARLAADQRRRPRHEAAARRAVELVDARQQARLGRMRSGKVLERERPAGGAFARRAGAHPQRRRLLDDGVPLAAGLALALPALRDRAAVLADIGGARAGHGAGRLYRFRRPGCLSRFRPGAGGSNIVSVAAILKGVKAWKTRESARRFRESLGKPGKMRESLGSPIRRFCRVRSNDFRDL